MVWEVSQSKLLEQRARNPVRAREPEAPAGPRVWPVSRASKKSASAQAAGRARKALMSWNDGSL